MARLKIVYMWSIFTYYFVITNPVDPVDHSNALPPLKCLLIKGMKAYWCGKT